MSLKQFIGCSVTKNSHDVLQVQREGSVLLGYVLTCIASMGGVSLGM